MKGPAKEAKCEDLKRFAVSDDSKKFFQVGAQLPPQEKEELVEFLKRNVDVFAWNAYEAPRVDPSFICHHLNIYLSSPESNHLDTPLRTILMLSKTR